MKEDPEKALLPLLERFADAVDLVLVEGWKDGPLPKVEVFREGHGPLLASTHPEVLAVVTDAPKLPEAAPEGLQRFRMEEVREIAMFIMRLAREPAHEP